MPVEKNLYEGRKGQKRLRTIEKQIKRVNEEFEHDYADTQEMIYLEDGIRWEPMARLMFAMAQRNVNFRWNGLRDYGFIRLCRKWLEEKGVTEMYPDATVNMLKSILPVRMCSDLSEEVSALELS